MSSLAQAIAGFNEAAEFDPPSNWLQGRTLFGGLSAALALQAAINQIGNLPPFKAAQVAFIGPATGPLRYQAQLLRQGNSISSVSVDCQAETSTVLRAAFLFAAPRPSALIHDLSQRPPVEGPDAYKPLTHGPAVMSNFDLRPAGQTAPASGAARPELIAWVRHRNSSGVHPAVALIALADSLPPAAIATAKQFAPFSSVMWTLDFPESSISGDWFLLRSFSQQAKDGYSYQTMEAWDEQGIVVLNGCQSVAIYG